MANSPLNLRTLKKYIEQKYERVPIERTVEQRQPHVPRQRKSIYMCIYIYIYIYFFVGGKGQLNERRVTPPDLLRHRYYYC